MKIMRAALGRLRKQYSGYLEGALLTQFLHDFGIQFGAGHWAAGGFSDRFAQNGYDPSIDEDTAAQMQRVAQAEITGIEFHDSVFLDDRFRTDRAKISEVRRLLAKYNLEPANMGTNLFADARWKLGGITNANKTVRQEALRIALQAVEIAEDVGCRSVSMWPGSDGWDYNFEVNYGELIDRFVDGCIKINTKARTAGITFGVEAKLHEPREGNMVLPTTHMAILVAKLVNEACGGNNMGVAIDYGHEQMYAVEPASMLYVARKAGVPVVNFHLNNAKLHSNDEDRIAGTGDIWRFTDFCYAAIDTGYAGWFSEDQFTYRTDPVKSMALSREFFGNAMKKALMIYASNGVLKEAQSTGDDIIPNPKWQYTQATTIAVPPHKVWPWLVQIGQGRGGFYSYQALENLVGCNIRNTDMIIPECQQLKAGDNVLLHPKVPYPVALVEPGRAIVLYVDTRKTTALTVPGSRPVDYFESTWLFFIKAVGGNSTRLISRFRIDYSLSVRNKISYGYFAESISSTMQQQMLRGIKKRAEGYKIHLQPNE